MIKSQFNKILQRRKQGTLVEGYPDMRKTDTQGRVNVVYPINRKCFHLRMLPHVGKGPMSFISLRTYQGILYEIFKGVCKAMGLSEGAIHYKSTLSEAAL